MPFKTMNQSIKQNSKFFIEAEIFSQNTDANLG